MFALHNASPGFSTKDVIVSGVDLISGGYNVERATRFHNQLLDRLRGVPGVESVAWARVRPFGYKDYSNASIATDSYQPTQDEKLSADYNEVTEGFFDVLGIPIVAGREFLRTDDENAPPVAIINETMAAKFLPGKDAVGQRLKVKDKWMQVVGVAKNSNYRNKLETPIPFFYIPLGQNPSIQCGLLIRTRHSPASVMSILTNEVHSLDPNLATVDTIKMQEQVDRMSYTQRLAVSLLAIFGGMALFLAAIGIYAIIAYAVSQSTRELGLRIAVGAGAADVLRLVMSRGLILTGGGILIGVTIALLLTRLMNNLLYKVSPRDPLAFGLAFVVMTVVAFIACFCPAWPAPGSKPDQPVRPWG